MFFSLMAKMTFFLIRLFLTFLSSRQILEVHQSYGEGRADIQ